MAKIFNRDIELSGSSRITKNGSTIISATGKMEAPLQFTADDAILDSNGNEMLDFGATASAVNDFEISNAATGSGPRLAAIGSDQSVPALIVAKENGVFLKSTVSGVDTTGAIFSPTVSSVESPFAIKLVPLSHSAPQNVTYAATMVLGGLITRASTVGANRTDTLPSATQILNSVSTAIVVGSTFRLSFRNTGTNSTTLVEGGGGTFSGSKVVMGGHSMNTAIVFTNVSSGTEAYTVYNLGFGQIA